MQKFSNTKRASDLNQFFVKLIQGESPFTFISSWILSINLFVLIAYYSLFSHIH